MPSAEDALAAHRARVAAVLPTGDTAAIKRLYVELGELLEEAAGGEPDAAPLLSFPETSAVVAGLLAGVRSPVLDAGCGPRPATSMALAAGGVDVVALDIGLGTVRLARAVAGRAGLTVRGVVADLEALPFRLGAFAGAVCDDTIEHLPDDRAGAAELARVLRAGGSVVLATPNRWSAQVLWRKGRDRARGRRLPASEYYAASSHLREYTWGQLEVLVSPFLRVRRRATVGWGGTGWRHQLANRVTRWGPLRRFSRMVVVEAVPRRR